MHPRATRSLAALAETLFPGSSVMPGSVGLRVVERYDGEILDWLPDPTARRDLIRFLRLLDTRLGVLFHGRLRPFADLDPAGREAAVRRMARSPIGQVRLAIKALKGTLGSLYMNPPPGHDGDWAPWQAIGYHPGQPVPVPTHDRLSVTGVEAEAVWTTDVVVVGSGAGGGTAAAVLAGAGLGVVLIEKGDYLDRADFPRREGDALRAMYLDAALGTTTDGGITLLAGATVGGGTVVNYSTAFPTPDRLRKQWDDEAGFHGVFTGDAFDRALEAVQRRVGVTWDESLPSRRDTLLESGLRARGWHVDRLPRNVRGCEPSECGNCSMGCRLGAKQSGLETWLRDAVASGATMVPGAEATRILVEGGRAVGVVVRSAAGSMIIRARAVILAAGALHTPALMVRSGITGAAVGRHLTLHPVTAVWGRYPEPVDQWTGILQARYSDEFADLDGEGYGFKFETTAVHQSFPPLLFGFESGASLMHDLARLRYWYPIGILLRDRGTGRMTIGRDGTARWRYRFDRTDLRHLGVAVEKAAAVHAAAGAEEVLSSTLQPVRWTPTSGGTESGFASQVAAAGLGANRTVYVSFHQMSSARMGSNPDESVVGLWNEAHAVPGLFVMDGSAFPTASGVNPALTIQAVAHRAATMLAERLA
ncbi:MAG: GMC family oxidoreductase N-terminal domain-containing protein [Acidimicrobiia bacterium]